MAAVDIVPPVASEFLLIENGSVGAEERGTLVTFATIVANVVRLAAGFDVGVHAGCGRNVLAMEIGVRHLVQNWIVDTGRSGNLAKILSLGLAWFGGSHMQMSSRLFVLLVILFVVDGLVVWLYV